MIAARPRIDRRLLFGLFLCAVALIPQGCSAPTSSGFATVSGTVTTSGGTPVEGASILISYRPSFKDLVPPREAPVIRPMTIPGDAIVWVGVTDMCGDTVRTICADPCTPDVFWDGLDDDGRRVLDGPYTYWIEVEEDSLSDNTLLSNLMLIFTEYPDWDPADYRPPLATSNPDGFFSFNDRCLGLGEIIKISGVDDIERPITRWIDVLAIHPDGRRVWAESVFVPLLGSVTVDLVIEEPPTGPPLLIGRKTAISFGETAHNETLDLSLKFIDISDSRCPKGAVCIWEGDAAVDLIFTKDNMAETLQLHTNRRFNQEAQAHGYTVRLVEVIPYPDGMDPPIKDDYVAVVEVTELP